MLLQVSEYFVSTLNNVTAEYLSTWFCDNYIRRCASQCPHIASVFDSISSLTDLENVITVNNERQRSLNKIYFGDFQGIRYYFQHFLWAVSWNIRSNEIVVEQLQSIDSRFIDFYRALCLWRCASMLERGHSMNVVTDLILSTTSKPRVSDLSCISKLSTNTSVSTDCKYSQVPISLMRTQRLSNHNELLIEFLKIYLHTSLKCDCDGDFHELTNCQLNVYMACLCCSTKQYRTAVKHFVPAIT